MGNKSSYGARMKSCLPLSQSKQLDNILESTSISDSDIEVGLARLSSLFSLFPLHAFDQMLGQRPRL
jgi:hypothetical protein